MATTKQYVARRRAVSLDEIIARFHDLETSIEECHGLLSWLGYRYSEDLRHPAEIPAAAPFLMEIGNECEPHHSSVAGEHELRKRARIVLARHVVKRVMCFRADLDFDTINRLTVFYAAHKDHADLNARDLVVVHEFLEQVAVDSDQRISHDDAVHALVATGAWKAILEHRLYEAIPWICERLAKALGRQTVLTDWLWRPVLSGDDPDDLADCIVQAGLSKDDLIAFSEEIRRVVALCGMALGSRSDDDDDAEREAAKTLLVLVSRVNHAVFNLRG